MKHFACLVGGITAAAFAFSTPAAAQDLGLSLTQPKVATIAQTGQTLRPGITSADPARMLVIGDSLASGFGTLLEQRAGARDLPMIVEGRGRPSTGLSRADYYDWPANFAGMAAASRPDIVVAHFGANDMQSVLAPEGRTNYGTDAWEDAYRTQIRKILDVAAENDAVLIWLGPAPDGSTNLNNHLARLNPWMEEEALAAGASFIPLTPLTAPTGVFQRTVTIDGQAISMRTADGSHFTPQGYALVANYVLDQLIERFPELAPVETATTLASASDPIQSDLQ
ncbi:DUF459 domain-containing protein [Pelagovum pacificum]|uniref:DUF459 domain-containing protein n=1 Tax=Pelagovum pacificum TaxID=2588711 RepID=A0A5C5GEN7_9RHOB|nr:DUF459 domain-containing protein [Pelagovum pacificum]QQA44474.1 DUF459 domain-containing protein [Pelagovum pacificum]TNY32411.1 DUF459 domain-containing protein [Pelagovum pacificum]